ncbi:gap junction protein alpha 4 [Gadus macrocephalus]|uniref:gap junction protein alpha 4 n=1 Tax=Gadus macrocephalus TaxID=80720 RepID=UPI0028CB7F5D|nr:gap junction protein alpha 4 [Gadus macrocephalus]
MSRADWSFLEHLLEEGQEHSTRVGRVWLTVLLLFRMLVLGVAAESAWDDEQCNFVCNTEQPGCESVCYDRAFPISHFRYFVLQVIFVSTPTIFYFGYLAVRTAKGQSEEEEEEEEEEEDGVAEGERAAQQEGRGRSAAVASSGARAARKGKGLEVILEEGDEEEGSRENAGKAAKEASESPKLKGRLLGVYTVTISVTVLLEAGFIAGLWVLYDGFVIAARYECVGLPCPHTVDCFVSRPTEKTIFTIYTQAIAGLSLLLNLLELLHLLQLAVSQRLEKRYRRGATSLPSPRWRRRQPGGDHTPSPLPAQEAPSYCPAVPGEGYPEPPGSYVVVDTLRSEVNWGAGGGAGDGEGDIPPSYLNCLGGMRSTHSPRAHVKKHVHGNGKHRKDNHKVHAKLKHYV